MAIPSIPPSAQSVSTGFTLASPATLKLVTQRYVSSAWYNFTDLTGATDQSAQLQAFLTDCAEKSHGILEPGIYGVDSQRCLLLPPNVTLQGHHGASILSRLGATNQNKNANYLQNNGGAMLALAYDAIGTTCAYQTSRVASGSGATFNLVTSGASPYSVLSASVASGGTGYKVGDTINLAYAGAVLTILTVVANRGAVATVSVSTQGSSVAAVSNPVAQSSSTGQGVMDIVLDATKLANFCNVFDINFEGNDPGVALTSAQNYSGLYIKGALRAEVRGCSFRNFPNTACLLNWVKRGFVVDNYAENNGYSGYAGTSRNAYSNTGIYLTSQPSLNTDQWIISRNRAYNTGDVAIQYALTNNAVITDNVIKGVGSIGIEGEQNAYIVNDTAAQLLASGIYNVTIPGNVIIAQNYIDGAPDPTCATAMYALLAVSGEATAVAITFTSALSNATSGTMSANWASPSTFYPITFSNGVTILANFVKNSTAVTWSQPITANATATAYTTNNGCYYCGISAADGNEGRKLIANNQILNTFGQAIKAINNANGRITIADNDCSNVNTSMLNNGIMVQSEEVTITNNRLINYGQTPAISMASFGLNVRICGNELTLPASANSQQAAVIDLEWYRTRQPLYIVVDDNVIDTCPSNAIYIGCNGSSANTLTPDQISVSNNKIRNHNRATEPTAAFAAAIHLGCKNGAYFNPAMAKIDNNQFFEHTATTTSTEAPVVIDVTNTVSPRRISISGNIGQSYTGGYTQTYLVSGMAVAPTTGVLVANNNSTS